MNTYKLGRLVLATAVMLASGAIVSEAADVPPAYRAPLPPPFYNWTGLYVGVHAGGGFADLGSGFNTGSGFVGGGQIGYNYQINHWVWGLEVDVAGTSAQNSFGVPGLLTANINWNTLTTLTPKFGYAVNNWLLYGKVGGAWADISVSASSPFFGTLSAGGGTGSGWVVGVGAEYAFWNNWSAKVEYNHFDFGGDTSVFSSGSSATFDAVKAGINYHFTGFPF
jgi:outer membrane immunogenic protein